MILIVGAGPIGIEMAVALKSAGVEFRIVEAGALASTIQWYSPGTEIFSSPERLAIAGVPFEPLNRNKATREDYLLYLRSVVRQFDLPIETFRRVTDIRKQPDGSFEVELSRSRNGVGGPSYTGGDSDTVPIERFRADQIIFAIGNMHLPLQTDLAGARDNPWVSHYLGEIHQYVGRQVVIVGSGNSAAEAAVRLFHVGAKVTLCHRGAGFRDGRIKPWILPELKGLIKEHKVFELCGVTLREIDGNRLYIRQGTEEKILHPEFILLLIGYRQETNLFERSGITFEGPKPEVNQTTMESRVPGVFVIGTAAVGTESGGVSTFIENSHKHVRRVMRALGFGNGRIEDDERPIEEREL